MEYTYASDDDTNTFLNASFTLFPLHIHKIQQDSTGSGADFIEIHNTGSIGTDAVDLAGYKLADDKGVDDADVFTFPAETPPLRPKETRVLVKGDPSSFAFGIGKSDTVTLFNAAGIEEDTTGPLDGGGVSGQTWQRLTNSAHGYGTDDTDLAAFGRQTYMTPGRLNHPVKVFISEVSSKDSAADSVCSGVDFVELYNAGTSTVDLGAGYSLSDDKWHEDEDSWTIPAGTTILPGEFKVFCTGTHFAYGIGKDDAVVLHDPSDIAVDTTGTMDQSQHVEGYSWSRQGDETNEMDFVSFATSVQQTPGASNNVGICTSLVLNEIADKGTGTSTCNDEDWIELYNNCPTAINLHNWKLHDDKGVDHEDSYLHGNSDVIIEAGGHHILCGATDFQFGVGSDDTITLISPGGDTVDTVGPLVAGRGNSSVTYQRQADGTGEWTYRTPPTPGTTNGASTYVPANGASLYAPPGSVTVALNEISSSNTSAAHCNGEDWIELYNYGCEDVNLENFYIADEKGHLHADVYRFPSGSSIQAKSLKVLCKITDFAYGIGGSDTISLHNKEEQIIDSYALTGLQTKENLSTMQRSPDGTGDWTLLKASPNAYNSATQGGTSCSSKSALSSEVLGGAIGGAIVGVLLIAFVLVKTCTSKKRILVQEIRKDVRARSDDPEFGLGMRAQYEQKGKTSLMLTEY